MGPISVGGADSYEFVETPLRVPIFLTPEDGCRSLNFEVIIITMLLLNVIITDILYRPSCDLLNVLYRIS